MSIAALTHRARRMFTADEQPREQTAIAPVLIESATHQFYDSQIAPMIRDSLSRKRPSSGETCGDPIALLDKISETLRARFESDGELFGDRWHGRDEYAEHWREVTPGDFRNVKELLR